jgi:hypothetical protein
MPVVPTYDNATVAPQGLPDARMSDTSRLMQWTSLGAQEQIRFGTQMGTTGSEVAALVAEQQASVNEAAAKQGIAQYTQQVTGMLHGTDDDPSSGYLNMKGQDAADPDMVSGMHTELQQRRESIGDTLTNPRQRELFMQASQPTLQAAASQVATHAGAETFTAQVNGSRAIAETSSDTAIKSFNPLDGADNSMYQLSIARQKTELEHQASMLGLTSDGKDSYVNVGLGQTYAGVINHLAAVGQTKDARKFLALPDVAATIDEETQDKLRQILTAGQSQTDGTQAALSIIQSNPGSLTEQEAEVNKRYQAGSLDEDGRKVALQEIGAHESRIRSAQAEYSKSILGNIWDTKNQMDAKGQQMTLADISPQQMAFIKAQNLGMHVDSILSAGPVVDDNKLFNDLSRQSSATDANARQQFANSDLTLMRGQLTKQHYEHLLSLQEGIDKGNTKALAANGLVHDTVQATKADMLAAGFTLTPKPGSDKAKDLEQFETTLRDTLIAAQSAKGNGAPLSRDEARGVALGLMKDQALSGTGVGGFFQTTLPPWKMSDEQRGADWVVPDADRTQIVASLTKRGLPANDANIQLAYKLKNGMRK